MLNKIKYGVLVIPALLFGQSVSATGYTTEAINIIDGLVGDILAVVWGALPVVLLALGTLIGVFFLWRVIKNNIGRPRG